jgi:hypothetical protein
VGLDSNNPKTEMAVNIKKTLLRVSKYKVILKKPAPSKIAALTIKLLRNCCNLWLKSSLLSIFLRKILCENFDKNMDAKANNKPKKSLF